MERSALDYQTSVTDAPVCGVPRNTFFFSVVAAMLAFREADYL
jgi:hypothetical protein